MLKSTAGEYPDLGSPMDDPVKKLVNCLPNCRGKDDPRFPQLLEAFREVAGNLTREADIFSQKIEETRKIATDFIQESNINSKLRIEVSRFQIELVRNSFHPLPVPGKAIFSKLTSGPWKYEVDCLVSCGDWRRLWELKEDKINIIDHLSELIPQKQQKNKMGPIGRTRSRGCGELSVYPKTGGAGPFSVCA